MRSTAILFAKRMFTEAQIKTAHSKVKTGADFPRYVQEIKQLGLVSYAFMVKDGQTVYIGEDNYRLESVPIYPVKSISMISSAETVKDTIKIHQQGKTDFPTFCQQVGDAGVEKWVVDTRKMMCIYYSLVGEELVAEPIPQAEY